MSVAINPGAIAFTRMPFGDNSTAIALVIPSIAALLCTIGNHFWQAILRRHGADIDNTSTLSSKHVFYHFSRLMVNTADICGNDLLKIFIRYFGKFFFHIYTGIVHQYVYLSELFNISVYKSGNRGKITHITRHRDDIVHPVFLWPVSIFFHRDQHNSFNIIFG